jgi:hypothetical protein
MTVQKIARLPKILAACCGCVPAALVVTVALSGCQPRDDSAATGKPTAVSSLVTSAEPVAAPEPPICDSPPVGPGVAVATEPLPEEAASERILPVRRPRNRDELVNITFDDLKVDMKEDQLFEPSMATDRVRELDGQRVRIRGFLFPAIFQQTGIDKFPLVLNTECKFGPGGIAHHVILVEMLDGATTSYTMRPIAVTGRLTLKPWNGPDGNTWALYHIAGERVD